MVGWGPPQFCSLPLVRPGPWLHLTGDASSAVILLGCIWSEPETSFFLGVEGFLRTCHVCRHLGDNVKSISPGWGVFWQLNLLPNIFLRLLFPLLSCPHFSPPTPLYSIYIVAYLPGFKETGPFVLFSLSYKSLLGISPFIGTSF